MKAHPNTPTTSSARNRAPRFSLHANLPDAIRYGIAAGANFELRNLRMREAREIEPGARKHHRLAMAWIADARKAVRS